MCALFRWIFFIFPLLCVLVLLIESYDENLTMTFISYSNGLTLNLQDIKTHSHSTYMLTLDMMLADYDDGFSVQRSSIISTDFPKHLLSIAKNIVVCNKTRNIGAVGEWCSLYRDRSGAAHFTWCRHHGDCQGRGRLLL